MMIPTQQSRRIMPTLLGIGALFFIVREPAKAAEFATSALDALMKIAEAIATFASHLG
ncbi:hypothetical protein AB0B45_46580 [Nonomuraea sp. NPDC049152]|uniref:hypothetical protein n=1 Tax=Nonomuraea sp. NPDC049152 TaxID=3154350 RepID=UPI0033D49079